MNAYSDQLPEAKITAVQCKLSSTVKIVMVGDNINDAPALALQGDATLWMTIFANVK